MAKVQDVQIYKDTWIYWKSSMGLYVSVYMPIAHKISVYKGQNYSHYQEFKSQYSGSEIDLCLGFI